MTISKNEIHDLVTSDKLHNKNCFDYLRNLKIPNFLLDSLPFELSHLAEIKNGEVYNPDYPYGDLYKRFFDYIDDKEVIDDLYNKKLPEHKENIKSQRILAEARLKEQEKIKDKVPKNLQGFMKSFREGLLPEQINKLKQEENSLEDQLDDFFISIYANDNKILEHTYEEIKGITLEQTPNSPEIKSSIAKHTKDKGELINQESLTPSQAESTISRVKSVFSDDYKPQHTTSLATVKNYKWNENHSVKEYRFGTQGQRHEGIEQVSPLFERFLKVQEKRFPPKNSDELRITHIYFNNLGKDRTDFEGGKESSLTSKLEELEIVHPNLAVITLPADQGLMDHDDYKNTTPTHSYDDVREEFLNIATEDPKCTLPIKDFHISKRIRKALFKDEKGEKEELGKLIDKSFAALGIDKGAELSPAQKQAVWFHFIKGELTNYIIDTLKPKDPNEQLSINFSCKDAIDRGGVSSAYYNLLNSFDSPAPMSREEFECALHAAPTMVKARGMNDHIKILWNTINSYVNTNYETLKNSPNKSWIIEWRDMNCPKARAQELLKHRIPQLQSELSEALNAPGNNSKHASIDQGLVILNRIKDQIDKGVSGKRLLLEAALRTPAIALNPTDDNIERYKKLSDKLEIKFPALNIIAGLMKSLVGLVVYAATRGKKHEMLDKGWATVQAGVEADTRKDLQLQIEAQAGEANRELQLQMKNQLEQLQEPLDIDINSADDPETRYSIN